MSTVAGATTICAFVALELSRALQASFVEEIARLEKAIPGVQWMDAHRMHLTLRFLGWTTRDRLKALEPHLAAAARICPPIDATVAGLGTFPPTAQDKARVLWAGIAIPRSGKTLQAACETAAVECGFPPERRAFQAHLTIGRLRTPTRVKLPSNFDLGPTRLGNLVLFRTEPAKGDNVVAGVRRAVTAYSKLATFPLG